MAHIPLRSLFCPNFITKHTGIKLYYVQEDLERLLLFFNLVSIALDNQQKNLKNLLLKYVRTVIAYFLIPLDISYTFFNGHLIIDNWRIFLMAGSLYIYLAAFLVYFMDESPKFLMAVGRHTEALAVFRKMYAQNTGNPPESYPVSIFYIKSIYLAWEINSKIFHCLSFDFILFRSPI